MNKQARQAIAQATVKNIKTEEYLNEFRQMLTKMTVEAALNAELDDHLGIGTLEYYQNLAKATCLSNRC